MTTAVALLNAQLPQASLEPEVAEISKQGITSRFTRRHKSLRFSSHSEEDAEKPPFQVHQTPNSGGNMMESGEERIQVVIEGGPKELDTGLNSRKVLHDATNGRSDASSNSPDSSSVPGHTTGKNTILPTDDQVESISNPTHESEAFNKEPPNTSTPTRILTAKSVPNNSAKRKPPSQRPDLSDDLPADVVSRTPAKRPKLSGKKEAREPLVRPKRSTMTTSQGRRRNEDKSVEHFVKSVQKVIEQPRGSGAVTNISSTTPNLVQLKGSKNKRGRPRKEPIQPAYVEASEAVPTNKPQRHGLTGVTKSPVQFLGAHSARDQDENTSGEVESLLMDYSPQKPPHMPIKSRDTIQNTPDEPEDELDSNSNPKAVFAPSTSYQPQRTRNSIPTPPLLDFTAIIRTLDEMLKSLEHVGQRLNKNTSQWKLIEKGKKVASVEGKRVERQLARLKVAYTNYRASKNIGQPTNEARAQITLSINTITDECVKILNHRLQQPHLDIERINSQNLKPTLTDLYFILIPEFVKLIRLGIKVHVDNNSVETAVLNETIELLDLLRKLVETALNQPKELQPDPPQNASYHLRQPVRRILPDLRVLQTKLKVELKNRNRSIQLSEIRREIAEQQRTRLEEEERKRMERRRCKEEILRMQKEDLARTYADPIWGPVMWKEVEKAMAIEARRHLEAEAIKHMGSTFRTLASTTIEGTPSNGVQKQDFDQDPFVDDEVERISVFGKHNTRKDLARKPWAPRDRELFVEIMSTERGITHAPDQVSITKLTRRR